MYAAAYDEPTSAWIGRPTSRVTRAEVQAPVLLGPPWLIGPGRREARSVC